jgi:TRAP transporter TAXI family solute receptor
MVDGVRRGLLAGAVAGMLAVLARGPARADQFVTVLTGGTASVYYPLGVALAKIYGTAIKGSRTSVQATKGSVENLHLLQQGKGEIAFAQGDSLLLAYRGDAEAGFKAPLDRLRGIAAIYPNYLQLVATADSGIRTLADLKGKRLSVGAPRSGTELNARAILKAAGIGYGDLGKVEHLAFAESVELMKNGQLDATLQSAGLGVASIQELAAAMPITLVPIPAELVGEVGAPYVPATVPAGTYDRQEGDVPTAAVANFLVTHSGVSDEIAYAMTKALWDQAGSLAAAHAAAKDMKLEQALVGMPVPLHPGAARFYQEKGML